MGYIVPCVPVGGSRRLWGCRVDRLFRCLVVVVFVGACACSLLCLDPVDLLLPLLVLCAALWLLP